MAFLGGNKQSLNYLLPQADQDRIAAQQKSAAEVTAAAEAAKSAQTVPYTACDPKSLSEALMDAREQGKCVDVVLCDNQGRVVSPPTRQCFPEPAASGPQAEALINQIKADEIEAGAIIKMLEMAKAADANSDQNERDLNDASAALESEANELKEEQNAAAKSAEARSTELARWRSVRDSAARTLNFLTRS